MAETAPAFEACEWIASDAAEHSPDDWRDPGLQPGDVCLVQHTSGSTSDSKGVMVSHRNLLANQAVIAAGMNSGASIVGVSWPPPSTTGASS